MEDGKVCVRVYAGLRDRDRSLSALRQFIDARCNTSSQRPRAMSVFDWLNEDPATATTPTWRRRMIVFFSYSRRAYHAAAGAAQLTSLRDRLS